MIEFVKANWNWLAPAIGGVLLLAYPQLAAAFGKLKNIIPASLKPGEPVDQGTPPAKSTTSLDAVHDALRVLYAQHLEIGVDPAQADKWLREGMMRAITGVGK